MSTERLVQLTSQWYKKEIKRFKPSLVNEVHDLVVKNPCDANIALLLQFGYFDNVLWRYFDADSTVNHIELIAVCVLYSHRQCVVPLIEKSEKSDVLFERCLRTTLDLTSHCNFRLHRLVMQLLEWFVAQHRAYGDFVLGKGNLASAYLKDNWIKTIVVENVRISYELETPEYICYLQSVLSFLDVVGYKDSADFEGVFAVECVKPSAKVQHHLALVTSKENHYHRFVRLFYDKKWVTKPTQYDCVPEDFKVLDKLSKEEVLEVLQKLQIDVMPGLPDAAYTSCLKHFLYVPPVTEESVYFDYFDSPPAFAFNLPVLDQNTYKIHKHLVSVLQRLNIAIDNKGILKIGGSSKYFGPVSKFPGKPALLLHIDKPNKFSEIARVKKYGIEAIKYTEGELYQGYNYYVALPELKKNKIMELKSSKSSKSLSLCGGTASVLSQTQQNAVKQALSGEVLAINVSANAGATNVLHSLLENVKGRCLVVFPSKEWLKKPFPSSLEGQCASFEHMDDPLAVIQKLLQKAAALAERLGEDSQLFAGNVTNAIIFYNNVVAPLRETYLKELQKEPSTAYPFADVTDLAAIVASETEIATTHKALAEMSAVLKFENDKQKVKEFLLNAYYRLVFASVEETAKLAAKFDTVVVFEAHNVHDFTLPHKKLIVMGDLAEASPVSLLAKASELGVAHINEVCTSPKMFEYYGKGYKLHDKIGTGKIIKVSTKASKEKVNVDEAEECVKLFKSLKHQDVGIVAASLYQNAVFQEMVPGTAEHVDQMTYHQTIILSLHAYNSFYDVQRCIRRCQSIYLVGTLKEPVRT